MADLEYLDRPWGHRKIRSLVFGSSVPDGAPPESDDGEFVSAGDGFQDVPGVSIYQMVCRAYDRGDVNAVHDVIQFEQALERIESFDVRAAVTLAILGWDMAEIGAALRNSVPAETLVRQGITLISRMQDG